MEGRDGTPCRSPWIEQLDGTVPPRPLTGDTTADVVVVGAGIAGVSTAFFVLEDTDRSVLLIEAARAGRGATGHNAGQLTTYFERPLPQLAEVHGVDVAIAAQRDVDQSWDLLDRMHARSGATVRVDRFTGYLGMFTLNHVTTHLEECRLRREHGLRVPEFMIADDAPFVGDIGDQHAGSFTAVPRERILELLETTDRRYCALMSTRSGCANGALLVQQVLGYLATRHPDRFRFADHTAVRRIDLDRDHVQIEAGDHHVRARHVVLCTNGFQDHIVHNHAGDAIHRPIFGTVGYMAGYLGPSGAAPKSISFIRNAVIGESTPYVYVTRRPYDTGDDTVTLTCLGGPEERLVTGYRRDAAFPHAARAEIDAHIVPLVNRDRVAGDEYDYSWHGLMGYTPNGLRLIGHEPRNPVLLYNLGCNGVGFLPSIHGGHRVARLLRGDSVEPSLFDPT